MDVKMNFKGQITIWIIIAIILVGAIVLFLLFGSGIDISKIPLPARSDPVDANDFIGQCVSKNVEEVVDIMLPQGGFVNPRNYRLFNESKVEYLCENIGFYEPCINQHPVLLFEMEQEIENEIGPRIEQCFNELESEIENNGGEFESSGIVDVEVNLVNERIFVNVSKEISIKRRGQEQRFEIFNYVVISQLYNLGIVANDIAAQEAKYCNFETAGYSLTYPRFDIKKYSLSEPVRIYVIEDTKSGQTMMIAIRSCAIPPGI